MLDDVATRLDCDSQSFDGRRMCLCRDAGTMRLLHDVLLHERREHQKGVGLASTVLAGTFAERTTAEWLSLFRELGIPAAPLRTPGELFDNEHLKAIDFFEPVDTQFGPVRFPGIPTWFSRTPGQITDGAPTLGADTEAVLAELCRPSNDNAAG